MGLDLFSQVKDTGVESGRLRRPRDSYDGCCFEAHGNNQLSWGRAENVCEDLREQLLMT